jgi:SWI/SNF-related matrix-associated actin-dependent regulator of chromatin subfamily A member 5
MTPSATRRQVEASAKKAANAERKAQVAEIGRHRTAIEKAKVSERESHRHEWGI